VCILEGTCVVIALSCSNNRQRFFSFVPLYPVWNSINFFRTKHGHIYGGKQIKYMSSYLSLHTIKLQGQ
jgi:hypothetical protein